MPVPIGQIQSVLDLYNKQLKVRKDDKAAAGYSLDLGQDSVSISREGRRRDIIERIGDDAVKSFKQNSVDPLNKSLSNS